MATPPKPTVQQDLTKRYEALAARLGDLTIKAQKTQDAIEAITEEILALDKLAPTILAAERSGAERAMDDYKRQSQGRKDPKSFKRTPPDKLSNEEIQRLIEEAEANKENLPHLKLKKSDVKPPAEPQENPEESKPELANE